MPSTALTYDNRGWLMLSLPPLVQAAGSFRPRLRFLFEASAPLGVEAQIMQLSADLSLDNELLSRGSLDKVGQTIDWQRHQISFDIYVSQHILHFIEERFRGSSILLSLQVSGLLRVKYTPRPETQQDYSPRVPPDEWRFIPVEATVYAPLDRTYWVKSILEPTGYGEYILMELPIPAPPERERWAKALSHLKGAEEQFLLGDDAGVFSRCRGAFEAVAKEPADFERLFSTIPDPWKRKKVDALLKEANAYFQSGRHVSQSGPQQGEFPVDHRDAEFALGLARMFLTYIARLVVQSPP